MKHLFLILPGVLILALLSGCGTSNPVVATIGSEKITLEDFENSYAKNNGGWANSVSSSPEDRQRFLDLLVRFRLKVQEAKDQGLLHDSSVVDELNTYRVSVAQSYMLDKDLIGPHVREMYDHKLNEIHAAHILIRLPQIPTPSDTLAAYEKAKLVISHIPASGFETLAQSYSQDPQSAVQGGDVGWIVPGRVAREIEEAIYSLKEGEYTKVPVRTQFGYHVLKVLKRQPASGALRISHILKRFAPDLSDTVAVSDTVWMIYNQLRHQASFEALVRKYSDEPSSKERGGDIGYYERERLRPDIVNLLYSIPVDSISLPYRQPYGYHIFKVTGHRDVALFGELEKDLKSEYQQMFYQQDYAKYVKDLKDKYPIVVDKTVKTVLRTAFDTTRTPGSEGWSDTLNTALLGKTLFTCAGKSFTVRDFVNGVEADAQLKAMSLKPAGVDVMIDRLTETGALKVHALKFLDRSPELKNLMDEYLDGILLYRIEQDEVWKRIVVNDSLLRIFYNETKEKYRWPERVNFAEIYVTTDSARRAVQWKLNYDEGFLSVAEEYTTRPGYRDRLGIWGFQPYPLNELTQKASTMAIDSVGDFFGYQNGWSIIKVLGKDSARIKTFEEAGPELASAYQEHASKLREEDWIEALRQKYGVRVNSETLALAFKRKPVEKK